jgi:predicted nucleic acid-binding protein
LIFLLDTCVLSEATKPQKHVGVVRWLTEVPLEFQYVSAITLGELYYGTESLAEGKKRQALRAWIQDVEEDYAGRIVPFDQAIAAFWGRLRAKHPNAPVADSQIAATTMAYGFTLVTRNVRDFRLAELQVVNPWQDMI